MGRPEFQAPETQDDYANHTQEQDLFGLAVLIFHLLTGFHPYHVTNQPDHNLPSDRIKAWLFPPARRGVTTTAEYMPALEWVAPRTEGFVPALFRPGKSGAGSAHAGTVGDSLGVCAGRLDRNFAGVPVRPHHRTTNTPANATTTATTADDSADAAAPGNNGNARRVSRRGHRGSNDSLTDNGALRRSKLSRRSHHSNNSALRRSKLSRRSHHSALRRSKLSRRSHHSNNGALRRCHLPDRESASAPGWLPE